MEIPVQFYAILGFIIVTQVGLIFTGLKMIFLAGKFFNRFEVTERKADREDGAREMAVRAHKRVDKIESMVQP